MLEWARIEVIFITKEGKEMRNKAKSDHVDEQKSM